MLQTQPGVHDPVSLTALALAACFLETVFHHTHICPELTMIHCTQEPVHITHTTVQRQRRRFWGVSSKKNLVGAAGAKSGLNYHRIPDS